MKITAAGAKTCTAITKSDSTTYSPSLDAIYVGGGGDVAIVDLAGNTVTFVNVQSGTVLPVNAYKVMSTNTTATDMIGLQY
jgi:hypothetical protein